MVVTRQTTSPAPAVVTPIGAKDFPVDASAAARGAAAFGRCVACHGRRAVAAGMAPDLRASSVVLARSTFADVVRGGSRRAKGMPVFAEYTDEMLDDLRHYLRQQGELGLAAMKAAAAVDTAKR